MDEFVLMMEEFYFLVDAKDGDGGPERNSGTRKKKEHGTCRIYDG
jgi:hypothetical protein